MDFTSTLKSIIGFFMSIIVFFSNLFGFTVPGINTVDMSKFELTWSDEFEGSEIDYSIWEKTEGTSVHKGGYWNQEMAGVKDGNLVITSKYFENGIDEGDPAGWYSAEMTTRGKKEQAFGYYEIRCILPKGLGQWSAFWFMNDDSMLHPYPDGSRGGEIDVIECPYYGYPRSEAVIGAVHWGGWREPMHESIAVWYNVYPVKPYDQYNTYGFEWNENEYIFYVNGQEAARVTKNTKVSDSSDKTVVMSKVPMYALLTVETAGANGVQKEGWPKGIMDDNGRDFVSEFKIDYIRAYQYK